MSEERIDISQSLLTSFPKCGQAAYYEKVEGKPGYGTVAKTTGSAVHRSVREDLKRKLEIGTLRAPEQVVDEAATFFDAQWDEDAPTMVGDDVGYEKQVRAAAQSQAIDLSLVHNLELAPTIEPLEVERQLRLEIAGTNIDLVGTLDVREEVGGVHRIRDTKTSKSKLSQKDAAASIQGDFYSLLVEKAEGRPVDEFVLDVLQKTKTPKAYSVTVDGQTNHDPLLLRVEKVAKAFELGVFVPADPSGPSGWVCSEKFCGHFEYCPFGRKARKSFAVGGE